MNYHEFTRSLPDDVRTAADALADEHLNPLPPSDSPKKRTPQARLNEIRRNLLTLDQIQPVLRVNNLVKGWLTVNGLSMIYGPSNAGKTFVAIDIGMHVAAGEPWRGCKVISGPVLYIAAEGGAGIKNRIAAFKLENPHMASAPFHLLTLGLDLHGQEDGRLITHVIKPWEPVLVVVDTLARSMGEGDENAAKDAAIFVRNCDMIREATGAHVLIIHHTGKDEERGARGSSALRAAVDSEILVSSNHTITSQKQRDMVAPDPLAFTLRSVTLGVDEDGDPVTSAVVEAAEKGAKAPKPLKGKDQVAMTALKEALDKHGRSDLGNLYPSGVRVVEVEHWREECDAHGLTTGASESAARQAFKRAKDRLMDLDEVREFSGRVWRVRDDG